jgi:hypothetical protein
MLSAVVFYDEILVDILRNSPTTTLPPSSRIFYYFYENIEREMEPHLLRVLGFVTTNK